MTTQINAPSGARTPEACPEFNLPPHLRKRRLRTDEASEYLEQVHGVTIAPATLAKKRVTGGGPVFERMGRSPLYPTAGLDAWVAETLGAPCRSTSEE